MNKKKIQIKGMHCSACEILVKEELLAISGVTDARVNRINGTAEVNCSKDITDEQISVAIKKAGYSIGDESLPFIKFTKQDFIETTIAVLIICIVYFIYNTFFKGNQSSLVTQSNFSLPVVFGVGLTAGFSTCMALVGGLVLGLSAKYSKDNPNKNLKQKSIPQLYFNLGRMLSFVIFGGLLGMLGSVITLSPQFTGFLTIIVAIIMIFLGLQTIGIFPRISNYSITIPKIIYDTFGIKDKSKEGYSIKNAITLGGLTFFVPCGFTQAMQLFAISSGSFFQGALIMGIFALGTFPGLFLIGNVPGLITDKFKGYFFKTIGLAVLLLGAFNIKSALNVLEIGSSQLIDKNVTDREMLNSESQVIVMTQNYRGYYPSEFTVKKDVPVKWIVYSEDQYSCASSIYSSGLGINTQLKEGENIINFIPRKIGDIRFSCSMGMFTGTIHVVDSNLN